MVYLSRIYTKTGDSGETSLGDGSRVPKTDRRIAAYGTVDELNAVIGVALTAPLSDDAAAQLHMIQNDLFDLGADLCVPNDNISDTATGGNENRAANGAKAEAGARPLRVRNEQVARLERWIDATNDRLSPLESFILPGGTPAAAHLHHARTICRRAEISVLHLAARDVINPNVAVYLNRLSDYLFVLARAANDNGQADVLWVPGGGDVG